MRGRLRIGEVAKLLGVTPKTVRHYEEVGLLKQPERTEAGYRLYSADDLLRLHRIKRLRSLGLSLTQVKGVLGEPRRSNATPGKPPNRATACSSIPKRTRSTWRRAERRTSRCTSAPRRP